MSNQDDFFTPEEVDKQIDQAGQRETGERADAEMTAYLRSFYATNAQEEQDTLDRMWRRISNATPSFRPQREPGLQQRREREEIQAMHDQPTLFSNQDRNQRGRTLWQRLGILAAAVLLVALVGSLALAFYATRQPSNGPAHSGPPPAVSSTIIPATPTITQASAPFKVSSAHIAVTPDSIANVPCGTHLTVTYTATIGVLPHGPGGTVQFNYTVNNGRGQQPASLTFAPGQTSKTYSFTWSGALPADHTYPSEGGIMITSPNQLTSPLVKPSGACVSQTAFTVTSVEMAVSPASIQGMACGTSVVITYTATIHVAANGPGGTVQFNYTVNNGRGQQPASLTFAPGQTSKTYSFTWSGALPADHTYPSEGGIMITSPNQLISPTVKPSGTCH